MVIGFGFDFVSFGLASITLMLVQYCDSVKVVNVLIKVIRENKIADLEVLNFYLLHLFSYIVKFCHKLILSKTTTILLITISCQIISFPTLRIWVIPEY